MYLLGVSVITWKGLNILRIRKLWLPTYLFIVFLLHFSTFFWRGTSVICLVISSNSLYTFNQNFWVSKKNWIFRARKYIATHIIIEVFNFTIGLKSLLMNLKNGQVLMEKELLAGAFCCYLLTFLHAVSMFSIHTAWCLYCEFHTSVDYIMNL